MCHPTKLKMHSPPVKRRIRFACRRRYTAPLPCFVAREIWRFSDRLSKRTKKYWDTGVSVPQCIRSDVLVIAPTLLLVRWDQICQQTFMIDLILQGSTQTLPQAAADTAKVLFGEGELSPRGIKRAVCNAWSIFWKHFCKVFFWRPFFCSVLQSNRLNEFRSLLKFVWV